MFNAVGEVAGRQKMTFEEFMNAHATSPDGVQAFAKAAYNAALEEAAKIAEDWMEDGEYLPVGVTKLSLAIRERISE